MKAVDCIRAIVDKHGTLLCFRFKAGELDLEELRKLQELIGRELVMAWQAKRKATTKPAATKAKPIKARMSVVLAKTNPATAGRRQFQDAIRRPFYRADVDAAKRVAARDYRFEQ